MANSDDGGRGMSWSDRARVGAAAAVVGLTPVGPPTPSMSPLEQAARHTAGQVREAIKADTEARSRRDEVAEVTQGLPEPDQAEHREPDEAAASWFAADDDADLSDDSEDGADLTDGSDDGADLSGDWEDGADLSAELDGAIGSDGVDAGPDGPGSGL